MLQEIQSQKRAALDCLYDHTIIEYDNNMQLKIVHSYTFVNTAFNRHLRIIQEFRRRLIKDPGRHQQINPCRLNFPYNCAKIDDTEIMLTVYSFTRLTDGHI